jgi:hypothetical protein
MQFFIPKDECFFFSLLTMKSSIAFGTVYCTESMGRGNSFLVAFEDCPVYCAGTMVSCPAWLATRWEA